MCRSRGNSWIVLLCSIILSSAAVVCAQDLQISPMGWDYGNVPVGASETATFDLLGGWPTEVWVYSAFLNETPDTNPPYANPYFGSWSLGAFSFNPATWATNTLPIILSVGEHLQLDVIFTPPDPGNYGVYLGIESQDSILPPGTQAFLWLEGTGVPAVVPAPGAAVLGLIGMSAIGWLRRRRTL